MCQLSSCAKFCRAMLQLQQSRELDMHHAAHPWPMHGPACGFTGRPNPNGKSSKPRCGCWPFNDYYRATYIACIAALSASLLHAKQCGIKPQQSQKLDCSNSRLHTLTENCHRSLPVPTFACMQFQANHTPDCTLNRLWKYHLPSHARESTHGV